MSSLSPLLGTSALTLRHRVEAKWMGMSKPARAVVKAIHSHDDLESGKTTQLFDLVCVG